MTEEDYYIRDRGIKFYKKWVKPNIPENKKEWIKFLTYILVVITIGAIAINQLIGVMFKMQLLQGACKLCESYGNTCTRNFVGSFNLSNINFSG